MTIKTRNTIFFSCLLAIIVLFLFFFISSALMIYKFSIPLGLKELTNPAKPLFNLATSLLMLLYCLITGFIFYRSFRKTSSAEIFYFFMFLMLYAIEAQKFLVLGFNFLSLPFEWTAVASRVIYSAHIMGTLCLLASGLFSCGLRYQRLESVLGICFLVTLFLFPFLPLNTARLNSNLLFPLGLHREFLAIFLVIEVIAVANYLYAAKLNSSVNYYFMALGLALVFVGRELLIAPETLIHLLAGFVVLSAGTTLFAVRTHEIYLWF